MAFKRHYIYTALTLLLLGISTSLWAQPKKFRNELYLGVKGGTVLNRIRFKPNVDQNLTIGKSAGLLFRMISEPHIGIQVEFNYLEKGWEELPVEGMESSYFHKINYFEIPVMTHANLGKKNWRFTFNIGPTAAFTLSESYGFRPDALLPDPPARPYWGKPINSKVDFLFTGGIGTEYHFKKAGALSLDGRIYYSLTNLYDNKIYGYDLSQTNGAIITLAYLFKVR